MSLGIILSQRGRNHSVGVSGFSRIPRERRTSSARLSFAQGRPVAPGYHLQIRQQTRWESDSGAAAARAVAAPADDQSADRSLAYSVAYRNTIEPIERHRLRHSILVEPAKRYPHRRETQASNNRHHKTVTTQLRHDLIRRAKGAPIPDWRGILRDLVAATPPFVEQPDCSVKLLTHERSARNLLPDLDNLLWDVQSVTGRAVQAPPEAEDNRSLSFLVSGPLPAVEEAVADVLRVAKRATLINLADGDDLDTDGAELAEGNPGSSTGESPFMLCPWHIRLFNAYDLKIRASDIPKPIEWTKKSFEKYVVALVNGRMTPSLASILYPVGICHDRAVVDELLAVFSDERAHGIISASAFKMALAFIMRKGHPYRADGRALFSQMAMFGVKVDADILNIFAESAAKDMDLHNFQTTVRAMIDRGIKPTLYTWNLFLRMIKNDEVQSHILKAMVRKGFLAIPAARRGVAQQTAVQDCERAIVRGKDFKTFLADQERRYGSGWLNGVSGNKILNVLGRYGMFEESAELIDVMFADPRARPGLVTLRTVLAHCGAQNEVRTAIRFVQRFEASTDRVFAPDEVTFHHLFGMAWRNKLPHLLGMVWRYAWLVNRTSWRMRLRVLRVLLVEEKRARITRHLRIRTSQGNSADRIVKQIFFGEEPNDASYRAFLDAMSKRHAHRMVPGPTWNYTHYLPWEPDEHLGVLLDKAFECDRELHRAFRLGKEGSLTPLRLPIRKRTQVERDIAPTPQGQTVVGASHEPTLGNM